MAATEALHAGATLGDDGRWRLRSSLGSGGMATVWLADDERLGRPVAVKVLASALAADPVYPERLVREARLAAALSHPNLVPIFDFSPGPPRPYLVMEYVAGGTLADRLRSGGGVDTERLARELLAALVHVHGAGIVHRDIKPGNVLLDHSGRTRLTDFGIARPSQAGELTATGLVIGTLRYIAPEVLAGGVADARSDLFALGVLLREAVGETGSRRLRRLADELTSESARDRPASAAEALRRLDGARSAPSRRTLRALEPQIERRGGHIRIAVSRPAALVAVALALVVSVLLLATLAGGGTVGPPPSPPSLMQPPPGAPLARQLGALARDVAAARR